MWIFWLVLAIGFVILEIFTVSFYSLWFAVGAAVASLISLAFPDLVWLQILLAAIISLTFIPFTPKLAEKVYKRSPGYRETKFDVVGKRAIVVTAIEPGKYGVVKIAGHGEWSASANAQHTLDAGTEVVVDEMRGTILVVSESK